MQSRRVGGWRSFARSALVADQFSREAEIAKEVALANAPPLQKLVQPRRRVSTKPIRGAGEGKDCLRMLEMPFCSHQVMHHSSGPIPAATCRHSRGSFEKSWDISALPGHFVWWNDAEAASILRTNQNGLLLIINREFQIRNCDTAVQAIGH